MPRWKDARQSAITWADGDPNQAKLKEWCTRNWAARAEWERTDELEVEMLSIGVEYRF